MSKFSVPIPLDNDGFLRRECPSCEQEFKWHNGPVGDRPDAAIDPPVYYCPLCGESALPDQWWTRPQLEYVRQMGLGLAQNEIKDMLPGFSKYEPTNIAILPALHEPNDMTIAQPPCHQWKPVKVPAAWQRSVYCLVCGEEYAI
jgi:hypothetical protein